MSFIGSPLSSRSFGMTPYRSSTTKDEPYIETSNNFVSVNLKKNTTFLSKRFKVIRKSQARPRAKPPPPEIA
ncbi:hypothetical protein BDW_02865 [Bdellovibrio bacteriovorus W]|nr:hypothetical protein BDW_02865 [Bdellovibrio bacteriovorus W]